MTPFCDYPESGERILGRSNLQALRSHHPDKPSGFKVKRILGNGNLWITEYTITNQGRLAYTVSIMEFATVRSWTRHSTSRIPLRRRRDDATKQRNNKYHPAQQSLPNNPTNGSRQRRMQMRRVSPGHLPRMRPYASRSPGGRGM
jgi:hypothetical protein